MNLKYLAVIGLMLFMGTQAEAQLKLRFATNVRYIAGGYIDKRPQFNTLEAALNDVKTYATVNNPYVFWVDSDTIQIADYDSVFTASGITMKDSIDIYYVAEGKIKWAGFGQGGGGSGTSVVIPTQTQTTTHYSYPNWDQDNSALYLWLRNQAKALDSIDQHIWDLIVYTDSTYLYIENDTLKLRTATITALITATSGRPDTTIIAYKTLNQTISGDWTFTGDIDITTGSIRINDTNTRTGVSRVIWSASNRPYWSGNGAAGDSAKFAMINLATGYLETADIVGWPNLDDATKDSVNAWKVGGTAYTYLTFDSTYTPDVTNGTPIRFAPGFTTDGNGMTVIADSVQVDVGEGGDFFFLLSMTLDVASTDDYQLDIQIDGVSVHTSTASGAGAGNYVSWAFMHYGDVDAESWISFYIDNLVDNDDPNITDINIYIYRIHQ